MLENKNVLFIAPSFFGYEHDITAELKKLGAKVDYFDERPFSSSAAKISNRLNFKFFIKKNIDDYYNDILEKSKNKQYDYLLIISPETMEASFINAIKATNINIQSILYMWDSLRNKSNAKKVLTCFDKIYSFDKTDLNSGFSSDIQFLPLFYNNDFKFDLTNETSKASYAASFIGTVHSDRVKLVKKVINQLDKDGYKTFTFFYCPSKLLFVLKKLFTNEFNFISFSEVSFTPMTKKQMRDIFISSNAVIDIQHPDQSGLTMRTIEMLGLNKKLITTNGHIREYDFYCVDNHLIIDRNNPLIDASFLTVSYHRHPQEIYEKYSLSSWLTILFEPNLKVIS